MESFLLNIIESNFNFQFGYFLIFYLIAVWLMVSIWVFIDAKKRFRSLALSCLFFLIVLILNIPGLLFYIILRPEREDDHVIFLGGHTSNELSGVNIPVVNFLGDEGLNISLNITVSKKDAQIGADLPEVKFNIDLADTAPKNLFDIKRSQGMIENIEDIKETQNPNKYSNHFNSIIRQVKMQLNLWLEKILKSLKNKDFNDDQLSESQVVLSKQTTSIDENKKPKGKNKRKV